MSFEQIYYFLLKQRRPLKPDAFHFYDNLRIVSDATTLPGARSGNVMEINESFVTVIVAGTVVT
jgi:hypothetical protein